MSTQSLITRTQRYAKGWGVPDLLKLAEQGQDQLFSNDTVSMRFVGGGNKGFPPFLKTTADVYRYDIKAANLSEALTVNMGGALRTVIPSQVISIFVDATDTSYGQVGSGNEYQYRPFGDSGFERVTVIKVPARSFPGMEGTAPIVEFYDDPGDSTERFFCEFTYLAPRLSSVLVPLCVPVAFEEALEDYMIGKIQMLESGKQNEFQVRFENYWKPKFATMMSSGTQKEVSFTPPLF